MTDAVNIILPIVLLIALGYWMRRSGFVSNDVVAGLRKLVVSVALPAVLFVAFLNVELSGEHVAVVVVKDFLAHRTEWGRMALSWLAEARAGRDPAVPAVGYTWGQLEALNAEIHEQFADIPLAEAEMAFESVNGDLMLAIDSCSDDELFVRHHYDFTGSSDLATYLTSATGGNYRSACKSINRWWRASKEHYVYLPAA